jgi:hypothetical protein
VAYGSATIVITLANAAPKPPIVIEAEPAREQTFAISLGVSFPNYYGVRHSTITFQPDHRLTFTSKAGKLVVVSAGSPWVMEQE